MMRMAWAALAASLVASIVTTRWLVFFTPLVPRPAAGGQVLLACVWSAIFTFVLYRAVPRPVGYDPVQVTLRTSATAVWFPLAMLSLSAASLGSVAAGVVLVSSATRMLCFHWRVEWPGDESQSSGLRALAISFTLQSGAVALLMDHRLTAGVLLGTGVALLTFFATRDGAWPVKGAAGMVRSICSVVLTAALGVALTVAWRSHRGGGGESDERAQQAYRAPIEPAGDIKDTSFPGVVIWPEVKPHTVLVPPLPALGRGLSGVTKLAPLSIPFAGEYWLFKAPYMFPPAKSLVRRGSPIDLGYITTDHRPMIMEAHHRLDAPIEVRCCSRIRLEISNADRYPDTVSLELILIGSSRSGPVPESLGKVPVRSVPGRTAPPWRGGDILPAPETLEFSLPENGALREFNEIKVVFHRNAMRTERSARISIDRIVFVPPGV